MYFLQPKDVVAFAYTAQTLMMSYTPGNIPFQFVQPTSGAYVINADGVVVVSSTPVENAMK
jgi:hypothetical protein